MVCDLLQGRSDNSSPPLSPQFMHNGGIAEFQKIKRQLQAKLSDELFNFVNGNTGE